MSTGVHPTFQKTNKSGLLCYNRLKRRDFGAEEGTRTPTAFRPPAPKAGASANSATSASPVSISSRKNHTIEDRCGRQRDTRLALSGRLSKAIPAEQERYCWQ